MTLDRLEVDHFRVIEHLELDLRPGINLFTGPNGAGKTSVLEAVHLLLRGRSFRRGGLDSQIRHTEHAMAVRGRFNIDRTAVRLDFAKQRGEPLELRRDRRRVARLSEIVALVPVQSFLPDLAELIFGAPVGRRKWLDLGLLYSRVDALGTMAHFRHVLRQRNAVLRTGQLRQLDAWDFELVASAEALTALRRQCFDTIAEEVTSCATVLCPEIALSLQFFPGHRGATLADDLAKQRSRDIQLRITHAGPHRADINVRVQVEGKQRRTMPSAASLVSQGQARALAAAFKLGQVRFLKAQGIQSLLLVDDLGSEWDAEHCDQFLTLLAQLGSQTVSSAVSVNLLPQKWQEYLNVVEMTAGLVVRSTL